MNGHPAAHQTNTFRSAVMKKFAIAAAAIVIGAMSLSTSAEAGWRHHGGWYGPSFGIVLRPAPRRVVVVNDYCYTKKVRHFDRYGNLYFTRVRFCD
jgi:hypothetical protein